MNNFVYYGLLFDIYKDLLNESTKNIFSLYYEENLTLQEIADILHVSKSYVGNVVKKTEKKLDEYENILMIYKTKEGLNNILKINDIEKIKKEIKKII